VPRTRGRVDHDTSGQACALTLLVPIQQGHESDLAADLDALPGREGSPLARVRGTHFARFVVLDQPVYEGRGQKARDTWKASRLLFTTNFDGPTDRYLEALRTGLAGDGDRLFGHCAGYPGSAVADRWRSWVLAHRVGSSLFFAAYGDQTVEEVQANLELRARLIAFALDAQGLAPAELRSRFQEAFPR
jgi:hypothetical protein